jgi:hypothetical protein
MMITVPLDQPLDAAGLTHDAARLSDQDSLALAMYARTRRAV